jgi:hypothetical protein
MSSPLRARVTMALVAAGGLALAACVATHTLAAALIAQHPAAAAWLAPDAPGLYLRDANLWADRLLQPPNDTADPVGGEPATALQAAARSVLHRDPLNARALTLLGLQAAQAGDTSRARTVLAVAAKRSLRQSAAVFYTAQARCEDGAYRDCLDLIDGFLRKGNAATHVMPLLGQLAHTPDARGPLLALLRDAPPWRQTFFSQLKTHTRDPGVVLSLLFDLKDTQAPATAAEVQAVIAVLLADTLYEQAYYAWLFLLPPDAFARVRLLNDGDFDSPAMPPPFGWTIPLNRGATSGRADTGDPDRGPALRVIFDADRVQFKPVQQMTFLTPGSYTLAGLFKSHITGRRGLRWRLTCAKPGKAVLAETDMVLGINDEWQPFSKSLVVPDADCRAQHLSLVLDARTQSERMVSGTVWFDGLSIVRQSAAQIAPDVGGVP